MVAWSKNCDLLTPISAMLDLSSSVSSKPNTSRRSDAVGKVTMSPSPRVDHSSVDEVVQASVDDGDDELAPAAAVAALGAGVAIAFSKNGLKLGGSAPLGAGPTLDRVASVQGHLRQQAHGPDNGWYRRAVASGTGRTRSGGVEADVTFATADPAARAGIDEAYHAKYERYGPRIVGAVTGSDAHAVTVRLVPTT